MDFKSKDEELDFYKRKATELEFRLNEITAAPVVKELNIPDGFEKNNFDESKLELTSFGNAKPIRTIELSEVDMKYFNGVDVMGEFVSLSSLHRENNRSIQDLQKMKDGIISTSTSCRAKEVINTLRAFFGFCKRMFGDTDFCYILEVKVVSAFPTWYRSMGRQPSTISNHIKTIRSFLKFVLSNKVFLNYTSKITHAIESLKPLQAVFSKEANSAKYLLTDERMRILGTWLTEPEFIMLSKYVCDLLIQKFDKDKAFVKGDSKESKLTREELALVMDHVYLLGLIYLGGQRNQFVASLSIKNVVFEGHVTKYLKTHEKVNRQKVDYFRFPLTFSVMLRVWMTCYLPLVRNEGVEACWVGSYGNAISHGKLGERVAPIVALYFPGRHITPLYFRRAVVTFIRGKSFDSDASGIDSFFKERLAVLMNTSPQVIEQNYDRLHRADENERTLKQVNDAIGLSPTAEVAAFVEEMASAYEIEAEDFRKGAKKVVGHKFKGPGDIEFTVSFEDGRERVMPGNEMNPLLHLVDVYWAQIGGPGGEKLVPKLPKKWNKRPKVASPKKVEVKEAASKVVVKEDDKEAVDNDKDADDLFGLDPVSETHLSPDCSSSVNLMELVNGSKLTDKSSRLDLISKTVIDSLKDKLHMSSPVKNKKMSVVPELENPADPSDFTQSCTASSPSKPLQTNLTCVGWPNSPTKTKQTLLPFVPTAGEKRKFDGEDSLVLSKKHKSE